MNRWILGARPRTLPAAVVPVAIGAGAAVGGPSPVWWRSGRHWSSAWPCRSASTTPTTTATACAAPTTFASVRYGSWPAAWPPASPVKRAALVAFGVAALAGLVLAIATTWWLIVVGLAGDAAGVGLHGWAEAVRLPRARRGVRVRVLRPRRDGRHDLRRDRGASRARLGGRLRRRVARMCAAGRQQPARHPDGRAAGKQTLAVRLGDERTRAAVRRLPCSLPRS